MHLFFGNYLLILYYLPIAPVGRGYSAMGGKKQNKSSEFLRELVNKLCIKQKKVCIIYYMHIIHVYNAH